MQVLACALLQPLGASADGVQCGELAAFCVHPAYRGSGRGDSLLDYVEQRARDQGIRRLVRAPAPSSECPPASAAGADVTPSWSRRCILLRKLTSNVVRRGAGFLALLCWFNAPPVA